MMAAVQATDTGPEDADAEQRALADAQLAAGHGPGAGAGAAGARVAPPTSSSAAARRFRPRRCRPVSQKRQLDAPEWAAMRCDGKGATTLWPCPRGRNNAASVPQRLNRGA